MRIVNVGVMIASFVVLAPNLLNAVEFEKDIVFATKDGKDLKMDIAFPVDGEMRPCLVCIHGGGWRTGSRQSQHQQMETVSRNGIVTATIDYRLTDVAAWPAQIEDVTDAIRWIVENAGKYKIDKERIGVTGQSAGGHLSQMVGLMPEETKDAFRVRGVVNFFGPSDLTNIAQIEHIREIIEALVGGKLEDNSQQLKDASPVTYIDRTDAPVLTFHGTADELVPIEHGEILHKALTKAQIPNRLYRMEGVGHTFGGDVEKGAATIKDFLEAYLKPSDMPLLISEDFDEGSEHWEPTDESAWKLNSNAGRSWFSLTKKQSDYEPKVRSPWNISLRKGVKVGDFVMDVDLRSTEKPYGHQSLCLFFGHQDATHFYYVHLGREADPHANSIFLVNDAPRVSIAQERTDGTDWSRGWHRCRIQRDVESGKIEVYFDDMQKPIMSTVDNTFLSGRVGIGSFDDTGDFDSIRVFGVEVN